MRLGSRAEAGFQKACGIFRVRRLGKRERGFVVYAAFALRRGAGGGV